MRITISISIFGIEEDLCSISWLIFSHLTSSSPAIYSLCCCRRNSFSWWGTFYQETTKHNIDIAGAWWGDVDIVHALILYRSGEEISFAFVRSLETRQGQPPPVPRFKEDPFSVRFPGAGTTRTWVAAIEFLRLHRTGSYHSFFVHLFPLQ